MTINTAMVPGNSAVSYSYADCYTDCYTDNVSGYAPAVYGPSSVAHMIL